MFVTKQSLERSEQSFVTNFNHVTHLAWGLYYISMPHWLGVSPVPGGARGQSLEGGLLLRIRKLFTKQALERSEQNFVTKFNHVTHLALGPYNMSMPNGLPQAQSQGVLLAKVWMEVYY